MGSSRHGTREDGERNHKERVSWRGTRVVQMGQATPDDPPRHEEAAGRSRPAASFERVGCRYAVGVAPSTPTGTMSIMPSTACGSPPLVGSAMKQATM